MIGPKGSGDLSKIPSQDRLDTKTVPQPMNSGFVRAAETGQLGYMIKLESSDAANLCAEALYLGYRSGEGISPGRLLRTAQALARAIMITLRSTSCCKPHRRSLCQIWTCLQATSAVHPQPSHRPCLRCFYGINRLQAARLTTMMEMLVTMFHRI